jgi:hypothetical protein
MADVTQGMVSLNSNAETFGEGVFVAAIAKVPS